LDEDRDGLMRIIAGRLRGRPLIAPKGMATRPTTDRVREALFSILGDVNGFAVVDCYSGTGALGIEAISRGAARAVLIETGKAACDAIRRNLEKLGIAPEVELVTSPVERCRGLLEARGPFDLVLSDPPWPIASEAALTVSKVFERALAETGTLVLGHPTKQPVELAAATGFELVDRRHWGDSGLSFFKRSTESSARKTS
jgi:16S rRNA (guanine966-N2)-methyltransferase